jgi:two-component system, NarL family, invasion response regulator UvrY
LRRRTDAARIVRLLPGSSHPTAVSTEPSRVERIPSVVLNVLDVESSSLASGPRRSVTVLCADDQSCFREVLRSVIAATPGFVQIGEAGSGEEAILEVTALRPDLVLMDVWMPGMNGYQAASTLVESRRDLVVALISANEIEPPSDFAPRGGEVIFLPEEELCPRRLLDLWHGRRTR